MGLSVMADAPDMDQAMRFANIAGQMQHLAPNQWVGEQNLDRLGLGDIGAYDANGNFIATNPAIQGGYGYGQPQNVNPNSIPAGIANTFLGAGLQLFNTIEQTKAAKAAAKAAARSGGRQVTTGLPQNQLTQTYGGDSGSTDMGKYFIYGGLAIAGIIVLMIVLKKKKKKEDGE